MILLPQSSYTRSQWKNGLGYTDQIAIYPATADLRRGDYLWRMSSATITRSSDFSKFPDHDRALVILTGEGLRLTHSDDGFEDVVELPVLEPYEFPGDIHSRCELLGGTVTDLSVFFKKDVLSVSVEIVRLKSGEVWKTDCHGDWNFLFLAVGRAVVANSEQDVQILTTGDTLRSEGNEISNCTVESEGQDSVFVFIRLVS